MPEQTTQQNPTAPAAEPFTVKPIKFIHRKEDKMPTYHADGAWGIAGHHNVIRINFFTENPPCPTSVVQEVKPDGSPIGPQKEEGVDDPNHYILIRDFQCSVILSLPSALQVHQMLGNFIRVVQQQMKEQGMAIQTQHNEAEDNKVAQQTK